MPDFIVRKMQLIVEEVRHDGGPAPETPRRLGAILACVQNPFAGRHEADIQHAMEDLKPLGKEMSGRLIAALGGKDMIDGYGKGAIVGEAGELEHGALWHVPWRLCDAPTSWRQQRHRPQLHEARWHRLTPRYSTGSCQRRLCAQPF